MRHGETPFAVLRQVIIMHMNITGNVFDITEKITYIGVADQSLDLFENQYAVPDGITYNSYIIKGEKNAVVDTTDIRTGEEWLANLEKGLAGGKPDYLIIEHLEPDHSTLISRFTQLYPDAKLVMSATALKMLPEYLEPMPAEERLITVKEGDILDLGGITLKFTMAPMVHWPEVMTAYCPEEKLIFTADAFGTFGTHAAEDWATEARRYYYNIVGKYGMQVQSLLKKLSGLEIKTICSLHGPVLRDNIDYYLSLYDKWSRWQPETDGIFIACASIHGNTLEAATHLSEELRRSGIENVYVADLTRDDLSATVAEAFRYPMAVFCAASYDGGLFTPMYSFLHALEMKGYCNRKAMIIENGSWAPSAARVMRAMLGNMKDIYILPETLTLRGIFKDSDIATVDALARQLAEAYMITE